MQGEMCEREGGGSFLKARAALAGVDLADQDEEHALLARPTVTVARACRQEGREEGEVARNAC